MYKIKGKGWATSKLGFPYRVEYFKWNGYSPHSVRELRKWIKLKTPYFLPYYIRINTLKGEIYLHSEDNIPRLIPKNSILVLNSNQKIHFWDKETFGDYYNYFIEGVK